VKGATIAFTTWAVFVTLAAVNGQEQTTPVTLSAASYAGGMLQPNEDRVERRLTVDASRGLTIVVTSTADLKVSLLLPDGSVASRERPNDRLRWYPFTGGETGQQLVVPGAGRGFNTLITLDRPAPGSYLVQLDKAQASGEPVPFFITLTQDSDLRMGLVTPFRDAVRGSAFVVSAVLLDGQTPIRGARVVATLTGAPADPASRPVDIRELALADDGSGADTRRGDGVYSGIVAAATAGTHWIAVRATGSSLAGTPFERHGGTSFLASEPTVEIASVGPGDWVRTGRSLRVAHLEVPVELKGPRGTYEVVVTLRGADGRHVAGSGIVDLESEGLTRVVVSVDAITVRPPRANGSYGVELTEVFELTKQERVLRVRKLAAPATRPPGRGSVDVPERTSPIR
jgi:hypothetical protein